MHKRNGTFGPHKKHASWLLCRLGMTILLVGIVGAIAMSIFIAVRVTGSKALLHVDNSTARFSAQNVIQIQAASESNTPPVRLRTKNQPVMWPSLDQFQLGRPSISSNLKF